MWFGLSVGFFLPIFCDGPDGSTSTPFPSDTGFRFVLEPLAIGWSCEINSLFGLAASFAPFLCRRRTPCFARSHRLDRREHRFDHIGDRLHRHCLRLQAEAVIGGAGGNAALSGSVSGQAGRLFQAVPEPEHTEGLPVSSSELWKQAKPGWRSAADTQ